VQVLVSGYWPSYNVAFFPEIYEACGYPSFIDKQQKRGPEYGEPTKWLMYQVRTSGNISLPVEQRSNCSAVLAGWGYDAEISTVFNPALQSCKKAPFLKSIYYYMFSLY
jgi:hypothetical protein